LQIPPPLLITILSWKINSEELIDEILLRSKNQESKDWHFTFENLQVEIIG